MLATLVAPSCNERNGSEPPSEADAPHPAGSVATGYVCDNRTLGDETLTWVPEGGECDLCAIPVEGVRVRLVNAAGEAVVALTDERGRYELPYLEVSGRPGDRIFWELTSSHGISIGRIGDWGVPGSVVCIAVPGLANAARAAREP